MDISNLRDWIAGVQFLWLVGVSAAVWLRKPGTDAAQAVDKLAEKVSELSGHYTLLEHRINEMPTHKDTRKLFDSIAEMNGDMRAILSAQNQQQRTLDMIQEFLHKMPRG